MPGERESVSWSLISSDREWVSPGALSPSRMGRKASWDSFEQRVMHWQALDIRDFGKHTAERALTRQGRQMDAFPIHRSSLW